MGKAATRRGRLFIVAAPSGAGKSTLCGALRRRFPDLGYSVSHTTRRPRGTEQNGVDYHFISEPEFQRGIKSDAWAEWAVVHGNHYGTSAALLNAMLTEGRDVLLDIDVQGADQLFRKFPHSVGIFIMPPDMETLRRRLMSRGTDAPDAIAGRLSIAEQEMARKNRFRHVLVNDDLDKAVDELCRIVARYRSGTNEN